jgi:hypothetical protein
MVKIISRQIKGGPQTPHSSSINMGEAYVKIRNKKLKNREEKKKN